MTTRKRKVPHDVEDVGWGNVTEEATDRYGHVVFGNTETFFTKSDVYYRDLYASSPDFRQLAKQHRGFAQILKANGQVDFSDPKSVMQLTKALLKIDFNLEIDLPDDRLCPPVPNRHNYILWLKALLDSTSEGDEAERVSGLDIGTGASCIYPLLGCTQRPWYFLGTDVDEESTTYARRNITLNNLQNRIKVLKRKPSDNLVPLDELGVDSITFVMTNPPFYSSADELASSAAKKSRPPNSACTGAPVEMVCPGGETSFVGRMLDESLKLRDRVRWYTATLGKAVSVEAMVKRLRAHNIDNYAVTELVQGNKTRRWAIGWSFGDLRPSQAASRGINGQHWRHLLPPIVDVDIVTTRAREQAGDIARQLEEACQSLELISWEWDRQTLSGRGTAAQNVWSRAWRRRKLQNGASGDDESAKLAPDAEQPCVLGFHLSVRVGAEVVVGARWTLGHESVLFESFCAYLRGRIKIHDP